MPLLLNLPNELLDEILDRVAPNDLENFALSCKRLEILAGRHLFQHPINKALLHRIENDWEGFTRYGSEGLLEMFLCDPSMADYVKKMVVKPWEVCWNAPPEEEQDVVSERGWGPAIPLHRPYPNPMMRAFEEAVKNSKSIPFEEKEHWISAIKAGDEDPIIALIFPRLHYLTCLELVVGNRDDLFMLKALQRIIKNPCSPSLSRLREVKILGNTEPTHNLEVVIACAALPSIVSLRACRLVEGPHDSAESTYELAPRSSSIRDLEISNCHLSCNTLLNLIRTAKSKSLRSFTYTYSGEGTLPPFAWVCAALVQFASKSLEELTLHRSHSDPEWDIKECNLKRCRKLRVLTINHGLLMGNKLRLTNKIVTLLPKSLETLNLYPSRVYNFAWFPEFVNCLVRAKRRKLPCLNKLNLKQTSFLYCTTATQIAKLCAAAREAGIEMTLSDSW